MASAGVEVVISARDQFTATANKVIGSLKTIEQSAGRVAKGVGQVGAGLARVAVIGAGAAAGGLLAAAKAGAEFEAALRTINTVARLSDADLLNMGDSIRKLARDTGSNLSDLTSGFYDLVSAGIDAKDAMGVLTAANTLAIGGLATNAETVDLLTTAINAYGQSASEAGRDADLFAKAIEIGKVKANEIAASFADVAPIAAQTGIGIEEIAAAYGTLTAQGTPAAEVATQMQRAIVELLNPSKELAALQDDLGVSFMQIARDKGLVVALQAIRDAVGGDQSAFQSMFGRIEAFKFALQTTGPQMEKYQAALDMMGKSEGTAARQMAERQKGLLAQWQKLRANILDAALTLTEGFQPALTRVIARLNAFLNVTSNRAAISMLGARIGKALDEIDWSGVLRGAQAFVAYLEQGAKFAAAVWSWIDKLPTEVKAGSLAFLGANKLSGGLIGQGLGNIVGGLGSAVSRGLFSKIPGVGQLAAQPVFVTNWPAGGLGMGGGAAAGRKDIGGFMTATAIGGGILAGALAAVHESQVMPGLQSQAAKNIDATQALIARGNLDEITTALTGLRKDVGGLDGIQRVLYDLNAQGVKTHTESLERALADAANRIAAASYAGETGPRSGGDYRPTINVTVYGTGAYGNTSTSYYGGSPAPAYSH